MGYVNANNVDCHVLRDPGPRHTFESTQRTFWRVNLGVDLRMNERFSVGVAGEFMRKRTYGSHSLTEPSVELSWHGARIWSDQKFIELNGAMRF